MQTSPAGPSDPLARVRAATARLDELDADRKAARAERDQAIRAAHTARVRPKDTREAAGGISTSTYARIIDPDGKTPATG
jgi:hypothetical protein